MKSTEKYSKNILLTKFIAFGLSILRRFKTNMPDRKLPRKQGNSKKFMNIVIGIVICPRSIEGLRPSVRESNSSFGARTKNYEVRRGIGEISAKSSFSASS